MRLSDKLNKILLLGILLFGMGVLFFGLLVSSDPQKAVEISDKIGDAHLWFVAGWLLIACVAIVVRRWEDVGIIEIKDSGGTK